MPSAAPDEALPTGDALRSRIGHGVLDQFTSDLRSTGYDGGDLAVAVSGGPDSIALLLLTVAAGRGVLRISAATVDHGLRAESADEARLVARLCERLGVEHDILGVTIPKMRGGIQAAAREARYEALDLWCPAKWLLVAHHRDDVAESLLMRLARGSGVHGLARMPASFRFAGGGATVMRPLLSWSKADLLGICARAGIGTITDPSNADPRYDRTAARTLLGRAPWLDPKRLYRSATNLLEASTALEWYAEKMWAERTAVDVAMREIQFDASDLPHDTKRRIVERIMQRLTGYDPDRQVETLIRMLEAGSYAMLADIQAIPGDRWRFRRAPPRRTG